MPHAVSPAPMSESEVLPDAPVAEASSDISRDGSQDAGSESRTGESSPTNKEKMNLEDMFDDDDEEESEFPSSSIAPPEPDQSAKSGRITDPEVMKAFYQRLFPFRYLFQWLNHSPSPTNDFAHREFAFTLQNDAYLRYQSFPTADLLRKQCINLNPSRFEIGPVYSTNPRERKTLRKASAFRPLSKELVFDIDMTDYDEIRTCCSGANICNRCWTFITMAIKVVDEALKEDFGFRHILWVYSGRRGAHAWVCDKRARDMDDQKRRAVASYLELLKGGDKSGKKVNVKRPLHPHLERSLGILKEHFQGDILSAQDPWADPEAASHLLKLLPFPDLVSALRKKWDSAPDRSSDSKWSDIDAIAKTGVGSSDAFFGKRLLEAKQDIVLEYSYPRLDAEVSKKLNHLLKSPFCVHPGTGRVCVPIDTSKVETFDPFYVPTVTDLLAEIDAWSGDEAKEGNEEAKKVQDWEKTSLKPYVDYFRGFVATLLKDEKNGKRDREEDGDPMEF
ncbi:MAG: hypothetical protein M1822_004257 [Bathelium mastoideum]|nr:MAG: hypothetical protein M1822_004257 [Bathelium mastoideum]